MSDLNQCTFSGRLGKDPEIRYSKAGTAICSFSIAVGRQWNKDGQRQEKTVWVNLSAFGKLAEICGEYLRKGSQVIVSGEFEIQEWEKDGQKRQSPNFILEKLTMVGGKQDKGDYIPANSGVAPNSGKGGFDDMDDDIPF